MKRLLAALSLLALLASSSPVDAQRALPAEQHLRVLVPAYFYPVPGSPWDRLIATSESNPTLVWAIGNPGSGPGAAIDPTYVATFTAFQRSGRLLGYVYTSYGARPLVDVFADIDTWYAWYAPDGIFVDEMDNVPLAHESYYRAIFQHVAAAHPKAAVVGNPGTTSTLDYLDGAFGRCASTLCLFENSSGFLAYTPQPWVLTRPRREFYALPHSTAAADWPAVVDHAFASHFGWVYVTNDTLPNPWDTLPPYFEAMVDTIRARY